MGVVVWGCGKLMTALAEVPDLVPTLSSLAADANTELAAIEANDADSLQRAIKAGEYLIQAKALCADGRWGAWVADNVSCDASTVVRYMRIAEHRVEVTHCYSITRAIEHLKAQGLKIPEFGDHNSRVTNAVLQRRARAQELRAQGLTQSKIAEQLGITQTSVSHLLNVEHARKRAREARQRRRAENAKARAALARQTNDRAQKKLGASEQLAYSLVHQLADVLGRLDEEQPGVWADALVAHYKTMDKVVEEALALEKGASR